MAVTGIRNHRKFRRLRSILKDVPDVYIEAHLNAMWTPAYQSANPDLGEEIDVELAAEWEDSRRPAGQWFKAVLESGFIDMVTHDNAGNAGVRYCVHDLFDWCPNWVLDKADKTGERRKEKTCNACGSPYRSSEPHSKYCSNSCRQKAFKKKEKTIEVTQGNAGNAEVTKPSVLVTQGNELPSPSLPSQSQPLRGKGDAGETKFGRTPTSLADPESEDPIKRLEGWELQGLGPVTSQPSVRLGLANWILDQRARKPPRQPTAMGVREQIGRLESMGAERAMAAIKFSIANGYTGIIEESENKNRKTNNSANPPPGQSIRTTQVFGKM